MSNTTPVNATAKTIKELFSKQYLIDYYQREYKWQTKQIKELIEDLTNKFKESYKDTHETSKIATYAPYFLGSVIISNKDGDSYIIDGQQRMTSLTLLLMFLRNQQQDKSRPNLDSYIRADRLGSVSFNINVAERNGVMESIFNNEEKYNVPDRAPDSVSNIYERYKDIQSLFPTDMYDNNVLSSFVYWLIEKVQLIEIVAYSDEEAYTIFETMNDRGLSLTPVDMLKGFILANIDEDNRSEVATIWKNQMLSLKANIGDNAEHEFFRDFFRAKYATKIRAAGQPQQDFDRMASEFHRWFREAVNSLGLTNSQSFNDFVKNTLEFYVKQYILINKASTNIIKGHERVYYAAYSEMPHLKIMMLSSISESDDAESVRKKFNTVSAFLETVMMKRSWSGKNTTDSGFKGSAFSIVKALRAKDDEPVTEIAKIAYGIEATMMLDNFNGTLVMNQQNKRKVYRILARITDHLEIQNSKNCIYESLFDQGKQGYEIEHILANNNIPVESLGFESKQAFATQRNEIGNLLLLLKSFNISYSNRPYEDKIKPAAYPTQNILAGSLSSSLYDNNNLLMHQPHLASFVAKNKLNLKPYQVFNFQSINERTELYAQILRIIFNPKTIFEAAEIEDATDGVEIDDDIRNMFYENDDNGDKNYPQRKEYKEQLYELIDAGLLHVGQKIYSVEPKYKGEALILDGGRILFNDTVKESLSGAGRALKLLVDNSVMGNTSGWEFWATREADGSLRTLFDWREEYRRLNKSDEY